MAIRRQRPLVLGLLTAVAAASTVSGCTKESPGDTIAMLERESYRLTLKTTRPDGQQISDLSGEIAPNPLVIP
jgi:hypothetical protein